MPHDRANGSASRGQRFAGPTKVTATFPPGTGFITGSVTLGSSRVTPITPVNAFEDVTGLRLVADAGVC
jgi:hypothetical protein